MDWDIHMYTCNNSGCDPYMYSYAKIRLTFDEDKQSFSMKIMFREAKNIYQLAGIRGKHWT